MGRAFISEPCFSCLLLILGAVAACCLCFLVLFMFLDVTWLLVGWCGGNGTHDVALLPSSCSHLDEMHPGSNTFLCVYESDCHLPCTQLSSDTCYCFNPWSLHFLLVPSYTGISIHISFRKILVFLLQISLYLQFEWQSRAKFCNYDGLFWSFGLLLVYEYLKPHVFSSVLVFTCLAYTSPVVRAYKKNLKMATQTWNKSPWPRNLKCWKLFLEQK